MYRRMMVRPVVVFPQPDSAQVLNLLNRLKVSRGLTYLFIAHDLSVVRFISDRIGVIYKGRIVEIAEAEELFNFPLHPYTHSLISAIPTDTLALSAGKLMGIAGQVLGEQAHLLDHLLHLPYHLRGPVQLPPL